MHFCWSGLSSKCFFPLPGVSFSPIQFSFLKWQSNGNVFGATSVRHTRLDPVVTLLVNTLIAGTALNPSVAPLAGGAVGGRHKANTTQSTSGSAGETFWPSQAVSLLIVNSPSCSQSPGTVSLCSLPCSGGFRSPPLCWLCIIIAVTARPLFWGTVPLWSLQPALVVWLSATQRAWLSVWSYNLWWICKVWASVTSVVIMTFASPFALLFWGKDSGDLYRCLRLSILQLFSQCFASEASLLCSAFGMPARYSPK